MIRIDKKTLAPLVQAAVACVGKGASAAFDAVRLSMEQGQLVVRSCDGVRDLRHVAQFVKGDDGDVFCVGAKGLAEAVGMMPDGAIQIALTGDTLRVSCVARTRNLKVRPVSEYPAALEQPEPMSVLRMPASRLEALFDAVTWAGGDDKWAANVHLAWTDGRARARTSNGTSLLVCREVDCEPGSGSAHVTVAAARLISSTLAQLPKGEDPTVSIGATETRSIFTSPSATMISMLTDWTWPERLPAPVFDEEPAVLNRDDLRASLKALGPTSTVHHNVYRVNMETLHGELVLTARDEHGGGAMDKLAVRGTIDGTASVNANNAALVLATWDSEEAALSVSRVGTDQIVLRPWPPKGNDGTAAQISMYGRAGS